MIDVGRPRCRCKPRLLLTSAGGADGGQRGFTSDAEVRCVVRRLDARLYGPTPPHTTAAYAGPDDA